MTDDPRVQAIRCTQCNRLRPYPVRGEPLTMWCFCGGRGYVYSAPFPDEEAWALQIYEPQIKERELWKYT